MSRDASRFITAEEMGVNENREENVVQYPFKTVSQQLEVVPVDLIEESGQGKRWARVNFSRKAISKGSTRQRFMVIRYDMRKLCAVTKVENGRK